MYIKLKEKIMLLDTLATEVLILKLKCMDTLATEVLILKLKCMVELCHGLCWVQALVDLVGSMELRYFV